MKGKLIAYIVPVGAGLDTFVYRELESLVASGASVKLFATKYKRGDVFEPKKEWGLRYLGIRELLLRSPLIFLRMLLNLPLLIRAIKEKGLVDLIFALDYAYAMRASGVNQIHCHHGDHKLFIGYYCKLITGLPLSVTIHAAEFYTNPNPSLFKKAVLECDGVFPIAEKWRKKLIHEYGVAEEKVILNRLFVDSDIYKPSNRVTVISVGRYTERKGFHYLLDAAKLLKNENVQFIFVGFGDLNLVKLADEKGVSDCVTVFNKMDQSQLRRLYQMSDILCVPSITTEREGAEGIPVVLMEGMACGLPVVATRCGAIEEIVEDYLVDEESPEQLAEALRPLILDKSLREQQGIRNHDIVAAKYSSKNVEAFFEELDKL